MNNRLICIALGAMLFTVSFPAQAQQTKKVPRIAFLSASRQPWDEALHQGLRELGYIEGQNIIIEYRYAGGKFERLPDLAAELVRLNVDAIVAGETEAIRAAKQSTSTIPIIMAVTADPVGSGFVASLARPGGNITGLTSLSPDLSGKRLELLKETVTRLARVAVLWNSGNPDNAAQFERNRVRSQGTRGTASIRWSEGLQRFRRSILNNNEGTARSSLRAGRLSHCH